MLIFEGKNHAHTFVPGIMQRLNVLSEKDRIFGNE